MGKGKKLSSAGKKESWSGRRGGKACQLQPGYKVSLLERSTDSYLAGVLLLEEYAGAYLFSVWETLGQKQSVKGEGGRRGERAGEGRGSSGRNLGGGKVSCTVMPTVQRHWYECKFGGDSLGSHQGSSESGSCSRPVRSGSLTERGVWATATGCGDRSLARWESKQP
ncbi:hypothetical protein VUR80DRAFT_5735 [Thermomyces stellatus]